jgi:hypothetical protein
MESAREDEVSCPGSVLVEGQTVLLCPFSAQSQKANEVVAYGIAVTE